jgi:hypothetical protein
MPHTTTLAAVLTHTTGIMVTTADDAWVLQDYVVGLDRGLMTHERINPHVNIEADLLAQFPRLAEAVPAPGAITDEETAGAWVAAVSRRTGVPMTVEVLSRAETGRIPS